MHRGAVPLCTEGSVPLCTKGKAPKEIERIDKPKAGQIHVHQKGKGATNADGTIHDKEKGAPEWSNKVVKWLRNYGFNI